MARPGMNYKLTEDEVRQLCNGRVRPSAQARRLRILRIPFEFDPVDGNILVLRRDVEPAQNYRSDDEVVLNL